jgi:hypothetical protein
MGRGPLSTTFSLQSQNDWSVTKTEEHHVGNGITGINQTDIERVERSNMINCNHRRREGGPVGPWSPPFPKKK